MSASRCANPTRKAENWDSPSTSTPIHGVADNDSTREFLGEDKSRELALAQTDKVLPTLPPLHYQGRCVVPFASHHRAHFAEILLSAGHEGPGYRNRDETGRADGGRNDLCYIKEYIVANKNGVVASSFALPIVCSHP